MPETLIVVPLLLKHPWSGLWSTFRVRVPDLMAAMLIARALAQRLRRHEEN